jgi:predicted acylesterase/phospholipase RssA
MSVNENVPKVQRALVLQGGGALGAYEAGVLNILTRNLRMEDKENGEKNRLLFDVIAGTSIGAMNGAILVSQYLETKSWDKASEELEKFWTDQLSLKSLDIGELNKPWYDEWVKRNPTAASEEAARRYYSVKKLLLNQVQNNMYYLLEYIKDDRLNKVIRIERTNYINSIYGKTGDLTFETIHKLIKEGECDAWFSLIQQLTEDIRASTDAVHTRDSLLNKWNQVIKTLRDNDYDYEANNSHIHRELTKFIGQIKKNKEIIDGLKTNQSTKLMDLIDRCRTSLD